MGIQSSQVDHFGQGYLFIDGQRIDHHNNLVV